MIEKNPVHYNCELRTDEWALIRELLQSIKEPKVAYSLDSQKMANEAISACREHADRITYMLSEVWEALGYD